LVFWILDFCVFTQYLLHRGNLTSRGDCSLSSRQRVYDGDERDDRDEGDVVPCVSGVPDDQNRLALSAFSVLRGGLPPQPLNRKFQGAHLGG
jgi:hypothetical protein